jgi:hypothetical protein
MKIALSEMGFSTVSILQLLQLIDGGAVRILFHKG